MSRAILSGSPRYSASIMGTSGQTYINALARLKGGFTAIPAFRADLARVTGRPDIDVWNNAEQFRDPARRVTGYEAACLLAFALAALVAAFFLVGQSMARYTSATVTDLQVLQAVGMTPRQAVASAAVSPFLAAAAGATLGVAGAIVASRWMPIGAASLVEPRPGVDADWLVLGTGWAVAPLLVLAGSAAAAATALAASRRQTVPRRSAVAAALAGAGLPVSAVIGARFALEPGRGRSAVPVRSAQLGMVAGVLGVLAAFTFSAGGPGADVQGVARRLNAAAAAIEGGQAFRFGPAPRPDELQEIKDVAVLPLVLSAFLALLAFGAVGHALAIAVRRRRNELAVLRALGMTRRQSRMVVTTQATVLALIGLAFGVPLGIALGRTLWRAVADGTPLAYHPPFAVWALLLVGPLALVAVNLLAAWPGQRAARLRTGHVLRAE